MLLVILCCHAIYMPFYLCSQMVALHKDPQGENVFKKIRSIPLSHISSSSARSVDKDVDNGMITLRERVTQLEGKLKSYEDKATVDEEPCN